MALQGPRNSKLVTKNDLPGGITRVAVPSAPHVLLHALKNAYNPFEIENLLIKGQSISQNLSKTCHQIEYVPLKYIEELTKLSWSI